MNNKIIILIFSFIGMLVVLLTRIIASDDNVKITEETKASITPIISSAKQVLKATYAWEEGFLPTQFTVKKGIPVRLEVFAKIDGFGCMGSIMIPSFYSGAQEFVKGQTNVFEFTPNKPGEYEITCAMGIPHGIIIVN